jgi:hypothetical protein
VEIDASGYVMGEIFMQGGKLVCYDSKMFHGGVLNYPTYDKNIYALVQATEKWKHYLMGKETISHIDHLPFQYFQAHNKLQQTRHCKWMGFLQ